MARALVAIVATWCTFTIAYGQPIQCHSDAQCQSNDFCVQDMFICRQCLNCEELKREPPRVPTSCVKSLVTCGGCMSGLVEDKSDPSAVCVSPDYTNNSSTWWWWVVGVGVVIVIVVVFVVLYLWYYVPNIGPKIFNRIQEVIDFPATSTSVQHGFNPAAAPDGAPSAPDCPPPYYETNSPLSGNPVYSNDYGAQNNGEVLDPFIKRAPSTQAGAARESAGSQAAFMFNRPDYVRGPHLPYDNAPEYYEAGEADDRDAFMHNEDTMESTWSPAENVHNSDTVGMVAGSGAGSAAGVGGAPADMSVLGATRNTLAVRSRPQDTNNNRNGSDSIGPSEGASGISCPVIINVVQTIGSLQQTNKFTH